jgi:hypothetical protein
VPGGARQPQCETSIVAPLPEALWLKGLHLVGCGVSWCRLTITSSFVVKDVLAEALQRDHGWRHHHAELVSSFAVPIAAQVRCTRGEEGVLPSEMGRVLRRAHPNAGKMGHI